MQYGASFKRFPEFILATTATMYSARILPGSNRASGTMDATRTRIGEIVKTYLKGWELGDAEHFARSDEVAVDTLIESTPGTIGIRSE